MPACCICALICPLNENTVICAAQHVSGESFFIICTNKLLISPKIPLMSKITHDVVLKRQPQTHMHVMYLSPKPNKTVINPNLDRPWPDGSQCLFCAGLHRAARAGKESTRNAETMSSVASNLHRKREETNGVNVITLNSKELINLNVHLRSNFCDVMCQ